MTDPERSTEPPTRAHRVLVPIMLVLASLALFTGAFAVWVNRQALNTDNWKTTSSKLLAEERIQAALGPYLVDQLFTNADVTGAIQQRLPSDLQGSPAQPRPASGSSPIAPRPSCSPAPGCRTPGWRPTLRRTSSCSGSSTAAVPSCRPGAGRSRSICTRL